jgi:hypothetical protein
MVIHTPGGQLIDVESKNGDTKFVVMLEQVSEDEPSIVRLWIDRQKGVSLRMNGQKGSVFDPGKGIHITDGEVFFLLSFESSMTLIGRVSMGNRPSQLCRYQKGGQEAYDWKVCAEYVRGDYPAEFTVRLVQLP